jgi:hypothetical protein
MLLTGWLLLAGLSGCANGSSSIWESSYLPSTDGPRETQPLRSARNSAGNVVLDLIALREVPADRIDQVMADLDRAVSQSDVPRQQWTPEQKAEAHAKLLRGLQVVEDPSSVEVLGVSRFKSTETLRPEREDARDIRELAAKLGAHEAVWSRRYLGKADKIVERPVTSIGAGPGWWGHRWDDRWGSGHGGHSDWGASTTSWVPVRVEADEVMYTVFFLRK